MLMDAQEPAGAIDAASRAVALEEEFLRFGAGSRYRLGIALNTLALSYSLAGRHHDAIETSRRAVEVLEAAADPAGRPQDRAALAQAMQNLGTHLVEEGAVEEALATTVRARDISQELADTDPQYEQSLSEALNDLALRYSQTGDPDLAVRTAAAAVERFQGQHPIASRRQCPIRPGVDEPCQPADEHRTRRGRHRARA